MPLLSSNQLKQIDDIQEDGARLILGIKWREAARLVTYAFRKLEFFRPVNGLTC